MSDVPDAGILVGSTLRDNEWWAVYRIPNGDFSDSIIKKAEAAGLQVMAQRLLHFLDGEAYWHVTWEMHATPAPWMKQHDLMKLPTYA